MSFTSVIQDAKESFRQRRQMNLQSEAKKLEAERLRFEEEAAWYEAAAKARLERDAAALNIKKARDDRFDQNFGWIKKFAPKDENLPTLGPNKPLVGERVAQENFSIGGDPFGFKGAQDKFPRTVREQPPVKTMFDKERAPKLERYY